MKRREKQKSAVALRYKPKKDPAPKVVAKGKGKLAEKIIEIARKLKKGSIIGIIVREDRMILPGGETTIEAGDHVIVITHRDLLPNIASLFKPRGLFSRR